MFKNLFKRSWLSVIRKPSRSIIIALILFAMGNLVLATIIIKSAVNETTEYAKESLGGTVSIQADMSSLREEMKAPDENGKIDFNPGQTFERPTVSKSIADDIATYDDVKDYAYSITSSADASGLTAVESQGFNPGQMMQFPGGMGGGSASTETETGDFTISGINAYAYIDGVNSGSFTIADGSYFNEGDIDKIMISQDLADANDLTVGKTITFTNIYTDKTYKLSIIGIYDVSSGRSDANTIYMNVDTAAKFLSADNYNKGDYSVENVSYSLVNAENVNNLINQINTNHPELAEQHLAAVENTTAYDQMVGPIESVGSFATTILIIVIVASVAIITLIVTINVKDRRYEMGVLLSLGARKTNIIGQVFVELALVGTVAFGLSCATSTALAQAMGQGILESQLSSANIESSNNFGRPTTGSSKGPGGMPQGMSVPDDIPAESTNNNAISEININASPIDFLLLFVCGYGIILIALLIPSINILRYQPKTILQGKE